MTLRSPMVPRALYGRFLLLIAGLGGLLYGIDIGIIGGALPYLEATSGLNPSQLSMIVAAVLLGSVLSTLFAGTLADWMGRRQLMIVSGLAFVFSIPIIALSHGYAPLFFGRLLQGVSGGLVGIVVPLYLAECLPAEERGQGTGAFQWLLTLGIVAAALIGVYYSYRVRQIADSSPAAVLPFKDHAWRHIFWLSLPPGVLFVLGSFFVTESPRWLFGKGRHEESRRALLQSRTEEQASAEMAQMEASASARLQEGGGSKHAGSLLQRKYVVPFLLACAILFCNTATGINSIIGYNTGILLQSGLSDLQAHWGYALFTAVNFLLTMVGMFLVDRVGRRRLFLLGTTGIVVSLVGVGLLFARSERQTIDRAQAVQAMVNSEQSATISFTPAEAQRLAGGNVADLPVDVHRAALVVVYSCGGFTAVTNVLRSDGEAHSETIRRKDCLPQNRLEAFLRNPSVNLEAARSAPLTIDRALISAVPGQRHGWLVALGLYLFMAFFAVGPGVCVWLALTELMPSRIRSNGMSIALVLNQLVSTTFAGIFLPFVGKYGYSRIFFIFATFGLFYLLTIAFFLPETKGKTLEQIEQFFDPVRSEAGSSEAQEAS